MPTTTKKVAPKKAVVKKVATKKVSSKKPASVKVLVYADNKRSFWVSDGQILNSLKALEEALEVMEKSVFAHHVTKDRHDFADWVEAVLCDYACATDLRKAKTQNSARAVVSKHLKTYKL